MDSPKIQTFLSTFIKLTLPLVDGVRVDKVNKDCIRLTVYKGGVVSIPLFLLLNYKDPSASAGEIALAMVASLTTPRVSILSIEVDKEDA